MKKLFAVSALLLASSAFAVAAPNLTGNWTVHQNIAGNESSQECTFVQADNKLTGTCKSNEKDVAINGSVDGQKATWKYESDFNGTPLTMSYTATLDDSSKIAGSVEVQPFAVTGDFTATPSKEAAK